MTNRFVPTPQKAKQAVDLMFTAMDDHYRELMAETTEFFEQNLVKLPSDSSIFVIVLSGLKFHCLHYKGKRLIVPEDMVEFVESTSLKKVLRKRYALNVLCHNKVETKMLDQPKVLEVLPCIAQGFKVRKLIPNSIKKQHMDFKNPGICRKYDLRKHPTSIEEVLDRPIFEIWRTPGPKGTGNYGTNLVYENARSVMLWQHIGWSNLNPKVDLNEIYRSDCWGEEIRKVLRNMKDKGQL